eukprot:jgi/Botrbrau1/10687/Bobra.139_2s0017.1
MSGPDCVVHTSTTAITFQGLQRQEEMRNQQARAAVLFLVAFLFPISNAGVVFKQMGNPAFKYSGDGTFYGQQSGQNDAGACSYGRNSANTLGLEWSQGVKTFIALNQAQFNRSEACGQCIMYRGLGDSPKCKSPIGEKTCGTTPIQSEWQMGLVDNLCPECSYGDIDLNLDGNGRWSVEWYAVPCNVGNGTLHYRIIGQNQYWFMFIISNTRVPVKMVETPGGDGVFYTLRRGWNNAWAANGGPFNFPIKLRITSVLDDVIEDWIHAEGNHGTVQFPERNFSTSEGGSSASQLTPEPVQAGPAVQSQKMYRRIKRDSAPLTTAFSGPADGSPAAAPDGELPDQSGDVADAALPAPEAAPLGAPTERAASLAVPSTSGPPSEGPSPSGSPMGSVAPPPGPAPTESELFSTPPSPSVPASSTPSTPSFPSSPPVPSGPQAQLRYPSFQVVKGGQCGGTRGFCTDLGQDQCKDGQWDGSSCQPGTTCLRYDATWHRYIVHVYVCCLVLVPVLSTIRSPLNLFRNLGAPGLGPQRLGVPHLQP